MLKPVPIGTRGEAEQTAEFRHTLTAYNPALPQVYSTPDMVRLLETAAFNALLPYCGPGELTVGTHINIEHRAASGIGASLRAEATLESINGRFHVFRVSARDHHGHEVGRGTVSRAFVTLETFMAKVAARQRA